MNRKGEDADGQYLTARVVPPLREVGVVPLLYSSTSRLQPQPASPAPRLMSKRGPREAAPLALIQSVRDQNPIGSLSLSLFHNPKPSLSCPRPPNKPKFARGTTNHEWPWSGARTASKRLILNYPALPTRTAWERHTTREMRLNFSRAVPPL